MYSLLTAAPLPKLKTVSESWRSPCLAVATEPRLFQLTSSHQCNSSSSSLSSPVEASFCDPRSQRSRVPLGPSHLDIRPRPEMAKIADWQCDRHAHLSSHHDERHIPAQSSDYEQKCSSSLRTVSMELHIPRACAEKYGRGWEVHTFCRSAALS